MVNCLKRGRIWLTFGEILFAVTFMGQLAIMTMPLYLKDSTYNDTIHLQANDTQNSSLPVEGTDTDYWDMNSTVSTDYQDENYTDYSNHSLVLDGSCHPPHVDYDQSTSDKEKAVAYVLEIWCGSIIGVLGILGNVCTIWILSRKKEFKSMFHRLLQWLALSDCFFISFVLFLSFSRMFHLGMLIDNFMAYFILSAGFASTFMFASEYITLAISLERFLGVCYPLRNKVRGPRNAACYIVPVIIWSVVFNSPRFVCELTPSLEFNYEWANHLMYVTVYKTYTSLIFTDIVPLLGLIFLNGRIWKAMLQSRKMVTVSNRDKKEQALGYIIVCIVMSFICTHACRAFLAFYMASVSQRTTSCQELDLVANHPSWMHIINAISSVMVLANCFNNFLIYCFVGSRFRTSLFRTLRTCCKIDEFAGETSSLNRSPPNISTYSRTTCTSQLSASRDVSRENSIERKNVKLIRKPDAMNGVESIKLLSISEQVEPCSDSGGPSDSSEWL